MNVILHPSSKAKLARFSENPPQGILLSGEKGVGLGTIARNLAGRDLAVFIEPTDKKTGEANPDTGTISIEVIRRLYEQTRTKQQTRRFVIIDDADRMSPGASAALLKLLEEPNEMTHFILTSHTPKALLPTIRSRIQAIVIESISKEQTTQYINELGVTDATKRLQLEYIAAGLPAELCRLASDENYFLKRSEVMSDTRTLLTGSKYDKLLIIHKYYRDKLLVVQLIDSALLVLRRSLVDKPQPDTVHRLDQLLAIREKINANYNARLQLMAFVL